MVGGMPPPPGMGGHGSRFYRQTDEKPHITKKLVQRILKNFAPYWKLLVATVITIIVFSILGLVTPILTKNIIDDALPNKDIKLLIIYIVLSLAAVLATNLVSVLQSYLNTLISKRITKDMRSEMYRHMQEMPLGFLLTSRQAK